MRSVALAALPALLLSIALLAGCADPAATVADEPAGLADLDLEATATTGVIRGVVVDAAIRPVGNATIEVAVGAGPARRTTTSANGAFGFDGLEAGTYFLQVSKPGFLSIQQSADVVAGVSEPPIVKILLAIEPGFLPYVSARTFEGFIECTTSFIVLCGLPNLLTGTNYTNDRFTWTWYYEPNGTVIQAEMAWESTQSLSPNLYFEMEALDAGCEDTAFFNRTEGPSPVFATINATQIEETLDEDCGVYFSLFSGHNPPLPRQPVTGWGIGATVQQRFTMFSHAFYDFLPPVGWRFSVDGAPEVPA